MEKEKTLNLTREETIRALDICLDEDATCTGCPLDEKFDCISALKKTYYGYLKENEPAPSANDTSSETTSQVKNTTEAEICQEEIDTISCANDIISGLKFMYPDAVIKRTMTDNDRCYVDFKYGNKNYSICLSHDTYADKQEVENANHE